jgi:hypothetical protein
VDSAPSSDKTYSVPVSSEIGTNSIAWAQLSRFYLRTEIGTRSIAWAQLSRFYLKTETGSSLRNTVFWNINRTVFLDKDRTMDNVQKHNNCTNVPLSQTFRSHLCTYFFMNCLFPWIIHTFTHLFIYYDYFVTRLCDLVVRVPDYRSRGLGFNSRLYQIFWEVVGLEWGPLSLVRITEELLVRTVAASV